MNKKILFIYILLSSPYAYALEQNKRHIIKSEDGKSFLVPKTLAKGKELSEFRRPLLKGLSKTWRLRASSSDIVAALLLLEANSQKAHSLQFSSVDPSIKIDSFGTICLQDCGIEDLSSLNQVENLEKLKILNLKENRLTSIPEGILDRCSELETVLLSNNNLTSLPPCMLSQNEKLKRFTCAYNNLQVIPKSFFEKCKELESIDLSHNNLKSLSADCLPKNLKKLVLTGNNLSSKKIKFLKKSLPSTVIEF